MEIQKSKLKILTYFEERERREGSGGERREGRGGRERD